MWITIDFLPKIVYTWLSCFLKYRHDNRAFSCKHSSQPPGAKRGSVTGKTPIKTARDTRFASLQLRCVPAFFSSGEIGKARETIIRLLKSHDHRVRQKAAAVAIANNLDIWKHLHPQTQQIELTHNLPAKIAVEFITPSLNSVDNSSDKRDTQKLPQI